LPDPAAQPRTSTALRLTGVSAPRRAGVEGLTGLDLELAQGDFLLVHGEAGAGKSLLMGLAGLTLRPGTGRLEILGLNPWRLPPARRARLRRRLGPVFQDMRLVDDLTVAENAALPMRIAGARPEACRRDVAELLDWMGLAGMATAYPQDLDHDQQQRLAVARAVAGRPEIILADEPVGWMGPEAARRVLRLLLQLNRQGATLIMASRNPDLAPAPRRLELVRGRALPETRLESQA
jgi:cell division transport system ATP-binding protein